MVMGTKEGTEELENMKEAAKVVIGLSKQQRDSTNMKTVTLIDSVTIPDAIALGGVAAIESVGAPALTVQLGRTEGPTLRQELAKGPKPNAANSALLAALTRDKLSSDSAGDAVVANAFKTAGLTERELTVLLGALLVLEKVEKKPNPNYKKPKAKLRERGKIGRASEFTKLSDADIKPEFSDDDDDEDVGPAGEKNDMYIVDSFGSRSEIYGAKASSDVTAASFNKYFISLEEVNKKKKAGTGELYWIERLLSKNGPQSQWVQSYAQSNLKYLKDLRTAYNAVTQLGGKFTGGKYESLLGNKKRKTLNDVEM